MERDGIVADGKLSSKRSEWKNQIKAIFQEFGHIIMPANEAQKLVAQLLLAQSNGDSNFKYGKNDSKLHQDPMHHLITLLNQKSIKIPEPEYRSYVGFRSLIVAD